MMLRRFCVLSAVALSAVALEATAQTWNMATPYPDATFHTQNIREFIADVEEATDGEVTIQVHSAGSLVAHPEIKRAIRSRQVQMGEVFISILGNEDPIYAIDSVPFLATSYDQAERLWEASRDAIEKRLAEDDIRLLYTVPWPAQGLYTSREIGSMDDLAGLSFRAYNSTTSRLAELLDMEATQVEVPEIPQAFSTGIIDAMITSPTTGVNSNAWDYVDRFYDIQAWIPKNMVLINQQVWDGLDGATQDAILAAAEEAADRGREMSREEAESQKAALEENGIEVIEPDPELMEGLREIGERMSTEWEEEAGPDGEAILEAYRE